MSCYFIQKPPITRLIYLNLQNANLLFDVIKLKGHSSFIDYIELHFDWPIVFLFKVSYFKS